MLFHGSTISALADTASVHDRGRAFFSAHADTGCMDEAWRTRLAEALDDKKMSKRAASLAAGLAPGYVHSILSEGKDPSVANLEAVSKAVGVSLQYLLYGYHVSPETARLLRLMEEHPEQRDAILAILDARGRE